MADLINEFSWSISSNKELAECKRMYYYTRYGSWEGWSTGKGDSKAKSLYLLKKLTKKEMWVGSVVHDIAKSVLNSFRNGYATDYSATEKILIQKMSDDVKHSREKAYQKDPKRLTGFFEDEYGLGISDQEINESIEFAVKCLQNFFNSEVFKYVQNLRKDQWLTIDEPTPLSFVFEGTKVYAKIDLAVKDGDRMRIYDWKTSRKEDVDYSLQLACYLAYAVQRWGYKPSNIDIFEVNLATGKITNHAGLPAKIEWFEDYLRKSIAALKTLLHDPSTNTALEKDFEQVNNISCCKRCRYLRVCKPPVLPNGTPV